jgi:hypothetical protein
MHSNLLPINSQFSLPIITGLGLSTNYHRWLGIKLIFSKLHVS